VLWIGHSSPVGLDLRGVGSWELGVGSCAGRAGDARLYASDSGGRRRPVTPLGFRLLAVVRAGIARTLEHQDETSTPFYNNLYDGPPGGIKQSSIFHD
jgi:hypothetical protein